MSLLKNAQVVEHNVGTARNLINDNDNVNIIFEQSETSYHRTSESLMCTQIVENGQETLDKNS